MTFAAPLFAWVSGLVALATVVLHLLAWRRPPESPLPTARFAPERPVRMVSRAVRPADLALLALRVSIIMLVGLALARPIFASRRSGKARVVVVDRSQHAGAGAEVAGAARSVFRPGDALVLFDSAAREVAEPTIDSIDTPSSSAPGSMSPALVRAVRAARRLARERDSVEIVIVSPFSFPELDGATGGIRHMWPGPVRLIRAGPAPNDTGTMARPGIRAPSGDPVAASLALIGDIRGGARVRVVRDAPTTADSAWARDGGALVIWPRGLAADGWVRRAPPDTAFAVTVLGAWDEGASEWSTPATVVAPMVRTIVPPPGRVSARWSDGDPAVTEAELGTGCVRSVAVPVPSAGDLPLTPAFRRFAARQLEPCAHLVRWGAASDTILAVVLPAALPPDSADAAASMTGPTTPTKLTGWLLGLALLGALAEMFVRRGSGANATA
jgi:hypothetical protein